VDQRLRENLEAQGGIEPPMKVLQTFALPLGYCALVPGSVAIAPGDFSTKLRFVGDVLERPLVEIKIPPARLWRRAYDL
jgi:hypothetical protein